MERRTKILTALAVLLTASAIVVNLADKGLSSKKKISKTPTSGYQETFSRPTQISPTHDNAINNPTNGNFTERRSNPFHKWHKDLTDINDTALATKEKSLQARQEHKDLEKAKPSSIEPPIFEKLRKSKNAPIPKEVRDLAAELTKGLTGRQEKAKAIYDWLTSNIVYDTDEWKNITRGANQYTHEHDPLSVLKRGSTVCIGYAWLFDALCESAGITSTWLIGDVRGYRDTPDDKAISDFRHAWNAFQNDDGTWSLLDATWGAVQEGDNSQSVKSRQDYYFDTPANQFIFDHLPENENWQLLEEPLQSETAFTILPNLKPSFFTNGLKLGDNYTSSLSAASDKSALFLYSAPEGVNVAVTLGATSSDEEAKELKILTSPDKTKSAAILPPLPKGEYILRIYSGFETSLLECSADFIISIE